MPMLKARFVARFVKKAFQGYNEYEYHIVVLVSAYTGIGSKSGSGGTLELAGQELSGYQIMVT